MTASLLPANFADNDPGPIEKVSLPAATVFVVDDDEDARKSVCALITSLGLPNRGYGSAEAFLSAYDGSPGCLVTDVRMPGIDGLELQQKLAERGDLLPVIVITAYANTPLTVKAMQRGAVTLLEKPCNDQVLCDAIRAALARDEHLRQLFEQRRDAQERLGRLSTEERQVLALMVDGKPNKVMASVLDVSLRTIEARRHHIFDKTRTTSLAELVKLVLLAEGP